jgi:sulfane dehydrogenase subunit SoxC
MRRSERPVAGNGLLHRRALLGRGLALAGASAAGATSLTGAAAEPVLDPPWSLFPGSKTPLLQAPSRFEKDVTRQIGNPNAEPGAQQARTPLHLLDGVITPNSLHFTVCHSGIPDIDPAQHKLVIHGMVRQPKVFDLAALARYPRVTRQYFIECAGNGAAMFSSEAVQGTLQQLEGEVSNAEWTGVPLSTLLQEVGVEPGAKWMICEGADSVALARSVPLKKGLDDAMIALYQNGERLMPGNGYPVRLLLPGYEGNMNVKFLRRIELSDRPAMTYYESRAYSQILPGGKAYKFYFVNEVKSFITFPSYGDRLQDKGYYEISGLAYSGTGRIEKVMVSADGGRSWAEAALQEPVNPKAFTRFRMPWRWDGQPVVLQSRAWDEAGNAQPLRADFVAARGQTRAPLPGPVGFPANQHYNSLTSWGIEPNGEIKHVYA